MRTSSICGRFSTTQLSPAKITAGMIATAAFFAPLMVTLPSSLCPPFIT